MVRKLPLLIFMLLAFTGLMFAQTNTVTMVPYGVSPGISSQAIKADTGTIYKYAYNGLLNVGIGTRTYVKVFSHQGSSTTFKLVNPAMGLVQYPSTSGGASKVFGPKLKLNDSTYIFAFTPDVLGTWVIKVTDGAYVSQLTFNAAKYLGVDNKGTQNVNCQSCHPTYYTDWKTTGHSTMFNRGVDGTVAAYYSASCIKCHTTGYDANTTAKNDGFDDFTFVFPATLKAGNSTTLKTTYPDAMQRANIQCESCHGPGSAHYGAVIGSKMEANWDEAVCNYCHDDASHHVKGEQFAVSKHGEHGVVEAQTSCAKCHTGKGFAQYADGIAAGKTETQITTDPYFDSSDSKINCQACHDPHADKNTYQLRMVSSFATDNATAITKGGLGRICMNCHKARTVATDTYVSGTSFTRFGPHHAPNTEVFLGTNFYTFGKTAPSTKHADIMTDGCLECHMAATDNGANGRPKLMGNHTFSMESPTGESNMKACATCHGYSLGGTFADVRFYYAGFGDLDRDGTVEGFQAEVAGYCDLIAAKLPGAPQGAAIISTKPNGTTWSLVQKQVLWNLYMILEDKSGGIHNPKFVAWILDQSYKQVGGTPLGNENTASKEMPKEFSLSQNYPNPFNPTTNIKFSLPKEAKVRLTVYDAIGKEIAVLIDNTMSAGSHVIQWNATSYASGVYFFRIEADNFKMTNKMLLMK